MCMTIFKAVSFGILFAIILFTLLYDKIFFKKHYYTDNPYLIHRQPENFLSKDFLIFKKGNWLIKETKDKDFIEIIKIKNANGIK